ncbi:TlpA family protein disulfide reductase [Piscinibacter sakaiensis]|uniref:Thiol:disulfide interchange protein, thioredoxin family n=1 Tax=Piscinibacter sakaiensis TaxID=1547922 RepID=A0A0K8P646_PISS1|nr:TlpA disulfide reductase family protein [Piscinibacter sakaiensis]GAP38076.1 thiol:disulfide interchange protein, thioredoxin family [Piscinibacter sakaiensis]
MAACRLHRTAPGGAHAPAAVAPSCPTPAAPAAPLAGRRRLLAAAAATLASGRLAADGPPPATGPFRWPELELLDGRRLGPADWVDMAAVVVVFATWCPFCRRHNPHVQALHEAVAGQRLRVIGASIDKDPATVRAYLAQHRYTFPVTMQGPALRERLGVDKVIPVTAVVDRQGRLRPPIPGEMFAEDVLELAAWAKAPVAR